MAVTAREQQIIDLYEAGETVKSIAEILGISRAYVDARVKSLCFGLGPDLKHRSAMMRGSLALAVAIRGAMQDGRSC